MGKREGKLGRKTFLSITGLIALFLILIFLNIIVSYANVRWDATEDQTYSLSEGTQAVLSAVTQPVTIKFFYTRSNPDIPVHIKLYAQQVKDFLSEYAYESNGMITVEMVDPKPDSDEEEWARKYGLQPMQVPGGSPITCGLVFTSADQEEALPFLDPSKEKLLEYDLTSIIYGLRNPEKKVMGIITSLPIFGTGARAQRPGQAPGKEWIFIRELKKIHDVRQVPSTVQSIDSKLDLLMVFFPNDLSPQTEYAIDQYVLSGGNVLIFVDPLCVSYKPPGRQNFMRSSGNTLDRVFKAWGVSFAPAKAVADFGQPTQVRSGKGGMEENPLMITARTEAFNRDDVITAGLESMLFPVAGALTRLKAPKEDKETSEKTKNNRFEPLVTSSKNAAEVEAFKAFLGVEAVKKDFVSSHKPLNLIVRVSGKFQTAFPDGLPKSKDDKEPSAEGAPPPQLLESRKPANLLIVSDADMLADNFYVQRRNFFGMAVSEMFNDNLNFLSNASELLTGSDELIGLRSRGKIERPFTAVLKLKEKARAQWLSKEQALVKKIEETNRKLQALESEKDASRKMIISPLQEAEIAKFRERKRQVSRELKEVRKNLRADIEALGATLKGINIFLMPLLVSIVGILFAVYKHRKLRKR